LRFLHYGPAKRAAPEVGDERAPAPGDFRRRVRGQDLGELRGVGDDELADGFGRRLVVEPQVARHLALLDVRVEPRRRIGRERARESRGRRETEEILDGALPLRMAETRKARAPTDRLGRAPARARRRTAGRRSRARSRSAVRSSGRADVADFAGAGARDEREPRRSQSRKEASHERAIRESHTHTSSSTNASTTLATLARVYRKASIVSSVGL